MCARAVLKALLTALTHILSVPFWFLFGAGDSTLTFGERKTLGGEGKDVEGKEGFEVIKGFQYMEVSTWLVLTYLIKDEC